MGVDQKHRTTATLDASPVAGSAKKKHSIRSSTGYWVARLARAMEFEFEGRLNAHGMTRGAFAVLSAITNDGKATPASLASFIGIDPAAITRHLDRLEKQELVAREPSPTDRRSVNLKLTRKGAQLVPTLAAHSKATNEKFLAGLTAAEKQSLHDLIQKMLANSDVAPGDI